MCNEFCSFKNYGLSKVKYLVTALKKWSPCIHYFPAKNKERFDLFVHIGFQVI